MALNRDGILGLKPRTEEVKLDEGTTVLVREMTGADRDSFEASLVIGEGKDRKTDMVNMRAKVAVRCLVDENGERLFEDGEFAKLGAISGQALDRIYEVAGRLSGIRSGEVEAAAKN